MDSFVPPVRKQIDIRDALTELAGKPLIKDLHDNEEICQVCHGLGMIIVDNRYGLSEDPNCRIVNFPYLHQSMSFCQNCYNGIVHRCPDCGNLIQRGWLTCECEKAKHKRREEEHRKYLEALKKAEKHEPNALGTSFPAACGGGYPYNEGYFDSWDDYFDAWASEHEPNEQKPEYVWAAEEYGMSIDATDVVENACDNLYDEAMSDIGDEPVHEMQKYLDGWVVKYGRSTWIETNKHAIRIPWEEYSDD